MDIEQATRAIHDERQRQIDQEGWTPAHDDTHENGEMLTAAVLYYHSAKGTLTTLRRGDGAPLGWPWDAEWWKPKSPQRDLERAGALCLAEKERLRRIRGSYRQHVDQKFKLIVKALTELAPVGVG